MLRFLFLISIALGLLITLVPCSFGAPNRNESELQDIDKKFQTLYCIRKNGKYGFIDRQGKIVIEPQFASANNFSEGLAKIESGGKYGYINRVGKVVIKPQFDFASNFQEELAYISIKKKYGFINKLGDIIIPTQYSSANNFSEGLAMVAFKDGSRKRKRSKKKKWGISRKCGFIDKTGVFIIKPQFGDTHIFSEGLAAVRIGDALKGKWGFIDKRGQFIIEPTFDYAGRFSEGFANVAIVKNNLKNIMGKLKFTTESRYGFINRTGKLVIGYSHFPFPLNNADIYRNGLVRIYSSIKRVIKSKRGKVQSITSAMGYMDKTGKIIWEPSL